MDITYCDKQCHKGIKASEEILNKNNSAFGAAFDFIEFTKECFKTCPYRDIHNQDID